jgi:hypothetical protein
VLAFNRGAVAEVVENGVTGYVVESVGEAICKVGRVLALDRGQVRRRFEERFTASRMTRDYLGIYAHLLEKGAEAPKARASPRLVANGADGAAERPAAAGLGEGVPLAAAGNPRTGS